MIILKKITIDEINKKVKNNPEKFIKECEEKFSKNVLKAVDYIKKNGIKYVFVSGPTSSGKTTFSKHFADYISDFDHIDISLDDYYNTLDKMPLKKNKEYNFESVNSLKLDILKRDFIKLKNGEEVYIPLVDFQTGKRVENNEKIKLNDNSIVVIEGLHALNKKILDIFEGEKIFRIFLCPEPEILRNNNPLSSYDLRFIRRMVRDNNYRNSDALNSLKMWKNVREGEKMYMSSYRKNADVVINTFLDYEPCILRKEALSLIDTVKEDSGYYNKAKRLKNILLDFCEADYKSVPETSLLNEFIKKD